MADLDHLEIEHKFIVDDSFDLVAFKKAVIDLKPHHQTEVTVRDVYYVPSSHNPCVLRHRFDRELQQLTMKSIGSGDSEVRTEVNLDLGQRRGDQAAAVVAFLKPFGILWRGEIEKQVTAFHLPKCEVVHYKAKTTGLSESRSVSCVEFEAVDCISIAEALETINKYEKILGFAASERSKASLFELILAPSVPQEVKARLVGLS